MELGLYEAPEGTRVEGKHWLLIGAGNQVSQVIAKSIGLGLDRFTVYHDRMTPEKLESCLRLVPDGIIVRSSPTEYLIMASSKSKTIVTSTSDLRAVNWQGRHHQLPCTPYGVR